MKRKLLDGGRERERERADEYMGVGLVPQNVNLSPLKLFFSCRTTCHTSLRFVA